MEIKNITVDASRKLSLLETGSYNSDLETHSYHYGQDTVLVLNYSSKQSVHGIEKDVNLFCDLLSFSSLSLYVVRTGSELFEMTKEARKLLICYLMEYVGFSTEEIDSIT